MCAEGGLGTGLHGVCGDFVCLLLIHPALAHLDTADRPALLVLFIWCGVSCTDRVTQQEVMESLRRQD